MNFVKKIADFFRGLLPKKTESTSENNEQNISIKEVPGDSKFLVFLKKASAIAVSYTHLRAPRPY